MGRGEGKKGGKERMRVEGRRVEWGGRKKWEGEKGIAGHLARKYGCLDADDGRIFNQLRDGLGKPVVGGG